MKQYVCILFAALWLAPLLTGCGTDGGFGTELVVSPEDHALALEVYNRLNDDVVVGAKGINVTVAEGIVTLNGAVANTQIKTRALTIARATRGIKGVVDRISVLY